VDLKIYNFLGFDLVQTRVNAEYMRPCHETLINQKEEGMQAEKSCGKFADNAAIFGSANINTIP